MPGRIPITIPSLHPTLDDAHDCTEYDPRCVDACAEPCGCGCNPGLACADQLDDFDCIDDEPYSRYGVLVTPPGKPTRAASGREAMQWARAIVKAGILPSDHPSVRHIRALRRTDLIVTAVWALAGGAIGVGFGWVTGNALTPTECGVLTVLTAVGYAVWLGCRK